METSKYQIYSTSQEAWDAMHRAIRDAKKSIYWELFIFIDDEVGRGFFDILEEKARAGVDVKIVVDYLGSFWLSRKRAQQLRKSGVDLQFFYGNKPLRSWWRALWSRTHRKILVVDETIGFIGGVNIQAYMKDWWDIHVRVEGTIVYALLRSFAKSYIYAGGKRKNVKHLRMRAKELRIKDLDSDIELISEEPNQRFSRIRRYYTEAFHNAKKHIILFTPYYFPDRQFLKALWQARKRGVKVDLLLPLRGDTRVATYAAYAWFSFLLKIGVNVRLTENMMHGKGAIIDDDWAIVGSSNLDHISFYDNYEANIRIKNPLFVKSLRKTIDSWVIKSKLVDQITWERRGKWHRFKEWVSAWLYYLWSRRIKPE